MQGFILSKTWYYIISFTWGLPINLIGLIVGGILYILGYRPKKNLYGYVFEIGKMWGGINFGFISLVDDSSIEALAIHEFGHSIQACIFGPFTLIFVCIPSLCRSWYRSYFLYVKNEHDLVPYNYAWFEFQATMFGNRYYMRLEENE